MMTIVDSHCHIHDSEFFGEGREEAYNTSREAGVAMVCVGTNVQSSREAIDFCNSHGDCYPVVGIHPHDSKDNNSATIRALVEQHRDVIVGIGEIGLDYYYDHSPREVQQQVLREQLIIARDFSLPVSFHVRDAFEDFWPILDEFSQVRGVLHSFTDSQSNLEEGLRRGLLIGVNGISTFTKDSAQQELYKNVPLESMVIETDAPFLTPKPFRGKMNVPAYVVEVARHQAMIKGISPEDVIRTTTTNARRLFRLES